MKAKTAIKAKNKKKLYLFIPAIVVLLLLDAAAFTLAVQAQNVWLFGGSFVLLALTLIAVWQLASLSKSINKFYQTMEKQLSPYSNKALRDFPLPVLPMNAIVSPLRTVKLTSESTASSPSG